MNACDNIITMNKEPNLSAVALGKRSAEVRFKGKSKKERSEMMAKVRKGSDLTNAQ